MRDGRDTQMSTKVNLPEYTLDIPNLNQNQWFRKTIPIKEIPSKTVRPLKKKEILQYEIIKEVLNYNYVVYTRRDTYRLNDGEEGSNSKKYWEKSLSKNNPNWLYNCLFKSKSFWIISTCLRVYDPRRKDDFKSNIINCFGRTNFYDKIVFNVTPQKCKVFGPSICRKHYKYRKSVSCTQQVIRITREPEETSIGCHRRLTARTPYNKITDSSWSPTMEGTVNLRPRYGGYRK